jgi:hypothetical protein
MEAYRNLIAERTRDFTGREWVFAEIDRWLSDPEGARFFILAGEPGIGKSAIAARLAQIRDLDTHYFYIVILLNIMGTPDFNQRIGGQPSD